MSQLSNFVKCNKDIYDMESMLIAREKRENIISYVDFLKLFMWSGVFLIWNKHLVNNIFLLLDDQFQEPLDSENIIWVNYNSMWIELIQDCTKTSKSIKYVSRIHIFIHWNMKWEIHVMKCTEKYINIWGHYSFPCF